jgi:4-hydroxy-tetrahydrodipicolinate synthase
MTTLANHLLDGVMLPMVTPFNNDAIDLAAAQRLATYYRDAGVSSLLLFGSTGEGNLIAHADKLRMFQAVRECVDLPIVIGAGGVDTREVAAALKRFDKLDPAAYLIPPPYYLRPPQAGIIWHYQTLAHATERPIILYDIVQRTGSAMTVETMETLFQMPNIVGVKACDPDILEVLVVRGIVPACCGEDTALLDYLDRGGRCAISAAAHVRPDLFVELLRLARTGNHAHAKHLFQALKPVIRLLYSEPNPAPIKKFLAQEGLISDELRRPLMPASADLGLRLRRAVDRLAAYEDAAVQPGD